MVLTVHQALQQLLQDPKGFLSNHLVHVGDFAGASGVVTAKFQTGQLALTNNLTTGQRHGSVLGSARLHGVQEFFFLANQRVAHQAVDVGAQFVQMYPDAGVNAIQWHPLAGAGSPNIMITTKLTGCSFLVRVNAGAVECAHVQPNAALLQTGQQLRQTLSTAHAGGYARLFGRGMSGLKGYGDAEAATVIGVRRNSEWKIYAQRLVNQVATLKEVQQIYPA